jgi:hypothetical protein
MRQHSNPGQVDTLEERRLLSAAIVGGVLKITGGAGDDSISLKKTTTSIIVTLNGQRQTFAAQSSQRQRRWRPEMTPSAMASIFRYPAGLRWQRQITGAADDSINDGLAKTPQRRKGMTYRRLNR